MKYTVCFLFTDNGDRVLMQRKDRTQFAGRYNGVGGKIEPSETPLEGARREIREETGADVQDLIWLGTLTLPTDCCLPAGEDNVDCELNFFAGTVPDVYAISQQPRETETLVWKLSQQVICGHTYTAGDGDVEYFVGKGYRAIKAKTSTPAMRKNLNPDLAKRYQAIADNLASESEYLRMAFLRSSVSMCSTTAAGVDTSMIVTMYEAVTLIRDLAGGGVAKDRIAHCKTVALNLAEKAKVFENKIINDCVTRYAYSRSVEAMEKAAAAIWELIKLNT